MSKSNTAENHWLLYVFNATVIASLATSLTKTWIALHTADPGEGGTQSTNETGYTGYTRVSVNRTGAGWVVTGASVSPAANIDFPACTATAGGLGTITHASIGTASAGAVKIEYSGTVTPNITMAVGVVPRLKTTSTIQED